MKNKMQIQLKIKVSSLLIVLFFLSCCTYEKLGQNEAIRVYTEYADGKDRGMFEPGADNKGYPDEDFDATTAMVINWHRLPELQPEQNARLRYRKIYPSISKWTLAKGNTFNFWQREELINRIILKNLSPNSIYEFQVKKDGNVYRLRTMPSTLNERPVKIAVVSDFQTPDWRYPSREIAKLAAIQKPDMFVVVGDLLNDNGDPHSEKAANAWAKYLDMLYGVDSAYFFCDIQIEGINFENIIIPHVVVVGNHDVGGQLMRPRDVNTGYKPDYPEFTGPSWLELLFHFPFSSEGFMSEVGPNHPNLNKTNLVEGFNKGGFGSLSFGDYFLLIALNNILFWEGEPVSDMRDWEGNLITDKWPWYGEIQSAIRQDLWLKHTLENKRYKHVIPFYHRALFGGTRLNMSHQNRDVLKYWMPLFYDNDVKFIAEGHEHLYTQTVPMKVNDRQPPDTYLEKVPYKPLSWTLVDTAASYLEKYYTVNCIKDNTTHEIVGWEYDGKFITYDAQGMIVQGDGGWAAGRRKIGGGQAGNAGWWFVDKEKGGELIDGKASFYITFLQLTNDDITIESFHPDELVNFQNNKFTKPIKKIKWDFNSQKWYSYDIKTDGW
jgi:hypothetical protein